MPSYDVLCESDGQTEVVAPISLVRAFGSDLLACPVCAGPVRIVINTVQASRIDDAENIGMERTDSTRGINLGLPGRDVIVGTRPDGRPRTEYRPIHSSEFSSNRQVREYALRNGMTPLDKGRFKPTPR